jgi:hypothetical protein
MDLTSQRVAAALSRMQKRDGFRSGAGGHSELVRGGPPVGVGGDDRIQA